MWEANLIPGSNNEFDLIYTGKPSQKMKLSGNPALGDFCIGRYDSQGKTLGRMFVQGGNEEVVANFIYTTNLQLNDKEDLLILDGKVVGIQRGETESAVCVEIQREGAVAQSTYVVTHE